MNSPETPDRPRVDSIATLTVTRTPVTRRDAAAKEAGEVQERANCNSMSLGSLITSRKDECECERMRLLAYTECVVNKWLVREGTDRISSLKE
ncbi:hypothetical protein Nepgr_014949 [Nepenthes gracilis]|uniref:Uncharacterized protein n=1 Tax=Nepenthes gracilis TaxID=150966 RepID=A0AAD3XQB3_NEPGR|nr:hypothetical protein Nepgr_014949 [Nepenthes gracilis]